MKTFYVLELTEHAEEAVMQRFQSTVSEGEPLDLVQIWAEHEWKDTSKPRHRLVVLSKCDPTDRCKAITDGRVVARGADQFMELAGVMQDDFFVWRAEEIGVPRNADKRASVQCPNIMTCIVQYLRHNFGGKAVGASKRGRP